MAVPTNWSDHYAEFQGRFFLAKRTAGVRGPVLYAGNVPEGKIQNNWSRREHKESTSNNRLIDHTQVTLKKADFSLKLEDVSVDNMQILLGATKATAASASYTGSNYDTFPAGLVVGSIVKIEKTNPTSLVVKDSAGSPATLAVNTDYKIIDSVHGLIEILSLGSYTQPFRAQYGYGGAVVLPAFEADDSQEWYAYCALYNTTPATDQAIGVEIWRMQFDPAKVLELINNDNQAQIDIQGILLRDAVRAADPEAGGYYRWIYNTANV
jgi:hypothetical protein